MRKLFSIMESADTRAGKLVDAALLTLITINVVVLVADSYEDFHDRFGWLLSVVETFSVVIFTIEFFLRAAASPYRYASEYEWRRIFRYLLTPLALIDLLAILPFYLPLFFPFTLIALRILRVVKLLRVLKIKRYVKALDIIVTVLRKKRSELVLSCFILTILIFFAGSLMYYLEHEAQPEAFPNIVECLGWSVKTMVFLGYPGAAPITPVGGAIGMIIVVLGLGWLSLPISIISAGFVESIKDGGKCPHCGGDV